MLKCIHRLIHKIPMQQWKSKTWKYVVTSIALAYFQFYICINTQQSLLFAYLDACDSNPCHNDGTCALDVDGFKCNCVAGYTGDTCQTGKQPFLNINVGIANWICLSEIVSSISTRLFTRYLNLMSTNKAVFGICRHRWMWQYAMWKWWNVHRWT